MVLFILILDGNRNEKKNIVATVSVLIILMGICIFSIGGDEDSWKFDGKLMEFRIKI